MLQPNNHDETHGEEALQFHIDGLSDEEDNTTTVRKFG